MSITFKVEDKIVVIQYDDEKIEDDVKLVVVKISRADLYNSTIVSFSTWRIELLERHLRFLEEEISKMKEPELSEAKIMIRAIKDILAQKKK